MLTHKEIRVGMVVRVRTIESMAAEFGPHQHGGTPNVRGGWCSAMNHAIGLEVRISHIFEGSSVVKLIPLTKTPYVLDLFNQYTWTLEMLELVDQPVLEHPEVSALLQMLGPPPASCINGPTARS